MGIKLTVCDKKLIEGFKNLKTGRDVAELLEIKYPTLTYYLYRIPKENNYRHFTFKKKSGGFRDIYTPITPLKIIQMKLNHILQLIHEPKNCVHGFLPGRSVITNAKAHLSKSVLLNIDIKDFFQSINFGRVRGMFMANPYNIPDKAATVLAQICCFNNILPPGAPTSPIISNMICGKLDSQLKKISKKVQCIYTRYADDMSFSSKRKKFPELLARVYYDSNNTFVEVGELLQNVIENNGFYINSDKVRLQRNTRCQSVTGITVNKITNVKRTYIKKIRAMIYSIKKHGLEKAEAFFINNCYHKQISPGRHSPSMLKVLEGHINYVKMVKGESNVIYRRLYNQFCEIMGKPITYIIDPFKDISPALWVLENIENDKISQGSAFMLKGVGLITCQHVLGKETYAFRYADFNKRYPVKIIAENKDLDLAILEIGFKRNITYLEKGNPDKITHGDELILAGFPKYKHGDKPYIVKCSIATVNTVTAQNFFSIDGNIVTGNSGGPVLNSQGQVIGVAMSGNDDFGGACDEEKRKLHGVMSIFALKHLINK